MIIGLTGKNCAGKGEAAKFLKDRSYRYYSLSDVIREEIKTQGLPVTRDNLIRAGNHLREAKGPGALAEVIVKRLEADKHYVIDSIRNPAEVEVLRKLGNFTLFAITADPQIRFQRILDRKRESDPVTYEDFIRLEQAEEAENATGQQLTRTANLADMQIENNGALEVLHEKLREALVRVSTRFSRPNWDEYFMGIARMVAMRSNCVKRKVASVIVKDKRIVSTGYNGTPRGVKNCNEGGCPRCNSFEVSGKGLAECLCSHAEENSITQAAYHGVPIKGSTLYTTFSPCLMCTKMIINSGIQEVVYSVEYTLDKIPLSLLREAKIKVRQLGADDKETQKNEITQHEKD